MVTQDQVKVWDPLVRALHWTLVGAFLAAFATGDEWLGVHVLAGYTVLGVVSARLVWGVVGTRHARFGDFVRGPRTVRDYLRDVLRGRARRYLGHNPAGGAMIVALLVGLTLTGVSGLLAYGASELAGPFAGTFRDPWWAKPLESVHEVLANLTLILAGVHVAGVLASSLLHRENLVRAMVTGTKARGIGS
ncbi:MAG: cytochrome b/b6 domain-containing protein [Gammaproteobacteria bacterium]|jgi:cytochrome b|nr:cytochrome b/b6 domain-containing protein [Gammaproteobacteria bacterium]